MTGIAAPPSVPPVPFAHLARLSDGTGLFEHAEILQPRIGHGYCVDDVARGLIVVVRERHPSPAALRLADVYRSFVFDAQARDGRFHNRRGVGGTWEDEPNLEDCWGRALWALGTVAGRTPGSDRDALARFDLGARHRSPHLRATAFAALGAAEILRVRPKHGPAQALLADAAAAVEAGSADVQAPVRALGWPWPEPRLRYANAALPETLIAAGSLLGDARRLDDGLAMLSWLLDVETAGGHLSVTPVGGWAPGEPRPGFDQQPIEVAALADACGRAFDITGDRRWQDGVRRAAAWFLGDNDVHTALYDDVSGGGCDGLMSDGRNENQGAESTLAMISTFQQAHRVPARAVSPPAGPAESDWVRRATTVLLPDPRRVITKLLLPGREIAAGGSPGGVVEDLLLTGRDLPNPVASRAGAVIDRVLAMSEQTVADTLAATLRRFAGRHHDLHATFVRHFALVADRLPDHPNLSTARRDLIGAYCTQEFSIESAALFNPSIVAHPDQGGTRPGEVRFVMSVRAVGEGHISSIEFRTGVLSRTGDLRIDDPGRRLVTGHAQAVPTSAGTDSDSYQLDFPTGRPLPERVIYPVGATESHGMEDARFVQFVDDDGSSTYYATYTAFDGSHIASRRLQTDDFRRFCSTPMLGPAARNKGMALFPRRVDGQFVALSRWDGQNVCVARSADGQTWGDGVAVHAPTQPWELVQLGNCGSPIETADGWLVLTHGVGPMRTYEIGAILLDLDDPTQFIGALTEPILFADEDERDGYVPNVVYSCGAFRHEDTLLLPYGCSDSSIRFALVDLTELVKRVRAST